MKRWVIGTAVGGLLLVGGVGTVVTMSTAGHAATKAIKGIVADPIRSPTRT